MNSDFGAADEAAVRAQLGRVPRSVAGVAARTFAGEPVVVLTLPRLEDGTPFPTNLYLTHPEFVAACSRLEADGLMYEFSDLLRADADLRERYLQAHRGYLQLRTELSQRFDLGEVVEIADFSAGGMPERVKCLHALVAHSLAVGPGCNPIGDLALAHMPVMPVTVPLATTHHTGSADSVSVDS